MAEFRVQWDDSEETVVRVAIAGRYTREEFFDAQLQASHLIESKPYRCDLIADLSKRRSTISTPAT